MRQLRVLLLVLVAALPACSDDSSQPPVDGPICMDCDITFRQDVLKYFEQAFNRRSVTGYDHLLDENFTFHLAPADVAHGLPELWGRAEEVTVATRMLDTNYTGPLRITGINVDLKIPDTLQWTEIHPGNGSGETWYMTTVFNEYRFEVGSDIYLSKNGAKVQLTVRNSGTEIEPAWRLVEWRELDIEESLVSRVATDQRSWGEIKWLFMQ